MYVCVPGEKSLDTHAHVRSRRDLSSGPHTHRDVATARQPKNPLSQFVSPLFPGLYDVSSQGGPNEQIRKEKFYDVFYSTIS